MLSAKNIGRCLSFCSLALALSWTPASAHELWMETAPNGTIGSNHEIDLCWGHAGKRNKGRSLESQTDKLTTQVLQPDGKRVDLKTALQEDCFTTSMTPKVPGLYLFGSELQTGIIPRPVHSIPANTRIIMYGKTLMQVGDGDHQAELKKTLGQDLEFVLLTHPKDLKPGGLVKAQLLFQGKPLSKKDLEVTLSTAGPFPPIEDPRIRSHEWSTTGRPDPKYGEMAFQLITSGKYLLAIKYYDETPGTYNGDRNDSSKFSHLRKGDTYERTMYVATLSFQVGKE